MVWYNPSKFTTSSSLFFPKQKQENMFGNKKNCFIVSVFKTKKYIYIYIFREYFLVVFLWLF